MVATTNAAKHQGYTEYENLELLHLRFILAHFETALK